MRHVILAATLTGVTLAAQSSGLDDIKANCGDDWPNNYQMQEFCIKQQQQAAASVARTIDSQMNAAEKGIMQQCASDWQQPRGYNWQMVDYCYQQQNAARKRLEQ